MKVARVVLLGLLMTVASLSVLVETGYSQVTTPVNQNNWCSLSDGSQAFAGTRFRRQGETDYYRCWYVLGRDAQPAGVAWIPGYVVNSEFFVATLIPSTGNVCTRPGNERYSTGAVLNFAGSVYRCSTIVGPDLKPSGVAWVEVDVRDNNTFVAKTQR